MKYRRIGIVKYQFNAEAAKNAEKAIISKTMLSYMLKTVSILLITLFGTDNLFSSSPPDTVKGSFSLGEIEVIGTPVPRTPVTVDRVIEPSAKNPDKPTIADAVGRLPGVHLAHVGERNETAVYVRGFDVKRVPLFLDGIPIYVPYDGYPDFGRFLIYDISAVVVSKGYSSVLYGPNTMGGAINMVSRKPEETLEGTAGISYASGNSRRSFINVGSRHENWYLQAGGVYSASDYFRVSGRNGDIAGKKRDNAFENDVKGSFKIGFTPNRFDEYAIGYSYQSGEKGTPVYLGSHPAMPVRYWRWPEWNKESIYFTSTTRVFGLHRVKTRLYYDTFENALYSYDDDTYSTMNMGRSFRSYYNDYTYGGSAEMSVDAGSFGSIRTAVHYKKDVHRERQDDEPQLTFADEILSAAVEISAPVARDVSIVAGASIDRLSSYRAEYFDDDDGSINRFPNTGTTAFNPQLAALLDLSANGTLHASVARKTRLPSMRDRYSFRLGRTIPNPSIGEERATHFEIGYSDLLFDDVFIKTEVFFSDVDDFIMFVTVPDPGNPEHIVEQNVNIGSLHKYGFDLHAFYQPHARFDIDLVYSFIHIDNRTTDDKIINIPDHALRTETAYTLFDTFRLRSIVTMYTDRYSSSDGERVADGFITADLHVEFPWQDRVTVNAGVNNLFDTAYEYFEGYPQPGRNYFAGLRLRW